jgi:hypothetical protein
VIRRSVAEIHGFVDIFQEMDWNLHATQTIIA